VHKNIYLSTIVLRKCIIMILFKYCRSQINVSSAVGLWNTWGNLGAEILNNLNLVNNMRLPQNFIPVKFKELLADKH
jgi:hypothetical protein